MYHSRRTQLPIALFLFVVFALCAVFIFMRISKNAGTSPSNAREGVVLIESYPVDKQGNLLIDENEKIYGISSGTGWVVGTPGQPAQYVVTNAHVIQAAYELPKADPYQYTAIVNVIYSAAENDFAAAQVVYYSPPHEKDLAIIKLPSPTSKRTGLALNNSDNVTVGEAVYALGYPGVSSAVQSYKTFDQSDITMTKGIISKRTNVIGREFEAFQMDTYINEGNSGGPLVDEQGFVIGINTLGLADTDMNFAITSKELIRILRAEGISFIEKGKDNWMIVAFAPLAALALIGALVLLSGRKNKGVSAAAAAVAGVYRKAVLRGVSGQFARETFSFDSVLLTLGRDAKKCNIVFKADTPGVSACHCTVRFNSVSNSFSLTDNGSTYGTFLETGQKLTPNLSVTLSVGQAFYLADGKQRFIVSME